MLESVRYELMKSVAIECYTNGVTPLSHSEDVSVRPQKTERRPVRRRSAILNG